MYESQRIHLQAKSSLLLVMAPLNEAIWSKEDKSRTIFESAWRRDKSLYVEAVHSSNVPLIYLWNQRSKGTEKRWAKDEEGASKCSEEDRRDNEGFWDGSRANTSHTCEGKRELLRLWQHQLTVKHISLFGLESRPTRPSIQAKEGPQAKERGTILHQANLWHVQELGLQNSPTKSACTPQGRAHLVKEEVRIITREGTHQKCLF